MPKEKEEIKFYHYSKNLSKIKKRGYISDNSFSKTNTYDLILEICPELFLDKENIKILRESKPRKRRDYESKYSQVKLKFKNDLINEFLNCNEYVLAFDDKLPKGWIKSGMFQLLANKIGNRYLEFKIDNQTTKKSFVLEQKYWSPKYSLKKFKINSWKKGFKIWEYSEIVKEIFGRYYLSIKKLSDYKKGEFEVLEVWIYGKIPLKKCIVGEISEKLIKEYMIGGEKLKKLK